MTLTFFLPRSCSFFEIRVLKEVYCTLSRQQQCNAITKVKKNCRIMFYDL